MIKKVITEYCDACGCKIRDYSSERDVIFSENDYRVEDSLLFCKDCTLSFNEWRKSRDPDGKIKALMNNINTRHDNE